jgi:hypothetical protein
LPSLAVAYWSAAWLQHDTVDPATNCYLPLHCRALSPVVNTHDLGAHEWQGDSAYCLLVCCALLRIQKCVYRCTAAARHSRHHRFRPASGDAACSGVRRLLHAAAQCEIVKAISAAGPVAAGRHWEHASHFSAHISGLAHCAACAVHSLHSRSTLLAQLARVKQSVQACASCWVLTALHNSASMQKPSNHHLTLLDTDAILADCRSCPCRRI